MMNFNSDIAKLTTDFLVIFLPSIAVIALGIFVRFTDVSMFVKMVFRSFVAVLAVCICIHITGTYIPVFIRVIVAFIVAIVAYHFAGRLLIKERR